MVFEEYGASFWVPVVVLVFHDACHESHFALWDFAAFAEDFAPFFDVGVFLGLVEHGCVVRVGCFLDHSASWGLSFCEGAAGTVGSCC